MMPVKLVQSGRAFERNGVLVTPMAEDRRCDDCGARHAAFGETVKGVTRCYCGWVDGKPACIGKGRAGGDLLGRAA
jgi:hypothetical protein